MYYLKGKAFGSDTPDRYLQLGRSYNDINITTRLAYRAMFNVMFATKRDAEAFISEFMSSGRKSPYEIGWEIKEVKDIMFSGKVVECSTRYGLTPVYFESYLSRVLDEATCLELRGKELIIR